MGTKRPLSSELNEKKKKREKTSDDENKTGPSLMWFRSDLRTADNPALYHASASGSRTIALYVISPVEWKSHNVGPFKVDFILRNLKMLSDKLAQEYQIPLLVKQSQGAKHTRELVVETAKQYNVGQVFFNSELEVDEVARDKKVREELAQHDILCSDFLDQCIVKPGMLRAQASGKPYSKFTPFKNAWLNLILNNWKDYMTLSPDPQSSDALDPKPSDVPDSIPGFELPEKKRRYWAAGEDEAHAKLKDFCEKRAASYDEARNLAAKENGTSRLSPYLASGVLSIKQCAGELSRHTGNKKLPSGTGGISPTFRSSALHLPHSNCSAIR